LESTHPRKTSSGIYWRLNFPTGRFLLNGEVLTADELKAAAKGQWAAEHEHDDLLAELGLDGEPSQDQDVHDAATALLASRQNWKPTADEYLEACQRKENDDPPLHNAP
jgi:hypothetical protein